MEDTFNRLPGFSDFLLVGLAKKGTVGPDFQASRPWLTGFSASLSEIAERDKVAFFQNFIYFIIIIYKCHKLKIKLKGLGTHGRVWGHVAGAGCMWQGVGSCGRRWGHLARCGHVKICQMSKNQRS